MGLNEAHCWVLSLPSIIDMRMALRWAVADSCWLNSSTAVSWTCRKGG